MKSTASNFKIAETKSTLSRHSQLYRRSRAEREVLSTAYTRGRKVVLISIQQGHRINNRKNVSEQANRQAVHMEWHRNANFETFFSKQF